jgi:hypothetical protein
MPSTWLPRERAPADLTEFDWWQPPAIADWLGPERTWDKLRYIVVDELHEGVAGLVVSPWPRQDERGRLHFGDEDQTERIAAFEEALLALLREERTPIAAVEVDQQGEDELKTRALSIGDVFAAQVRKRRRRGGDGGNGGGGEPFGGAPVDPGSWIRGEILDITVEGREVAKAQAAAAAAGVMNEDLLETILGEFEEDEEPPTTTDPTPSPEGSGSSGSGDAAEPDHIPEAETFETSPAEGDRGLVDREAQKRRQVETLREAAKKLRDKLTGKEKDDKKQDEEQGELTAGA